MISRPIILASFALLFATSCVDQSRIDVTNTADSLKIVIIESEHGGFGYDIFLYDKLKIHQPHVPSVPGLYGFATKRDAHVTASAVASKLRKNENPPTLTITELEAMGVVNRK